METLPARLCCCHHMNQTSKGHTGDVHIAMSPTAACACLLFPQVSSYQVGTSPALKAHKAASGLPVFSTLWPVPPRLSPHLFSDPQELPGLPLHSFCLWADSSTVLWGPKDPGESLPHLSSNFGFNLFSLGSQIIYACVHTRVCVCVSGSIHMGHPVHPPAMGWLRVGVPSEFLVGGASAGCLGYLSWPAHVLQGGCAALGLTMVPSSMVWSPHWVAGCREGAPKSLDSTLICFCLE